MTLCSFDHLMRRCFVIFMLLAPMLLKAQMEEGWIAPGASLVVGHTGNLGLNLRTHYIPNERMCIGLETNLFPEGGELVEREFTLNAHFFFEVEEVVSIYPLLGAGYEEIREEEKWDGGWRALVGGGLHKNIGRFAPYAEYIYGFGFESQGIFIIGTFYTFRIGKKEGE